MPRKRKAHGRDKKTCTNEEVAQISVVVNTAVDEPDKEDIAAAPTTDQRRTLALFLDFKEMFLQGEALRRMLHYFTCNCSACDQDNLTDVALKMLCTPLDMRLTKVGLNPFKDNYMFTLPYSEMTNDQKSFICKSVTKDIAFSRSVSMLANMNGGVCMRLHTQQNENVFMPQELLMRALVDCFLLDVTSHTPHTRWLIFTIVLQRIMSQTQLERSVVQRVSEYALQLRHDMSSHVA
jgi:hypothetical protein